MLEASFEPLQVNRNSSCPVSGSQQAPAAKAPARTQRDPSARQAAAAATAGREPARGAWIPGRRRRPGGGVGAEGPPRPPSAGEAGAAQAAGRCSQRAVTARQSLRGGAPFPENLAASPGPAREPPMAPRRGWGGRQHREVVPRPRGARRRTRGQRRKLHFLQVRPGALSGSVHWGPGGRSESVGGGRAARGPGGGVGGENHKIHAAPSPSRAPRATLPTPARVGGRGQVPLRPGRAGSRFSEKVPARG